MDKPWFIDLLTYGIVGFWMWGSLTLIREFGPDPWLLASAVIVLAAGLLLIYNQRLAYVRIGDKVVLGTQEAMDEHRPDELDRKR